jgi:hypothetical protein
MSSLIYKYFGKHGVDVIERLELKVTPPNQFNDVFEVTPRPSTEPLSREAFDELIDSEAGQNWLQETSAKSKKFRAGYASLGGDREKFYQFAVPLMPQVKQSVCATLLDKISERFGLICFCEDPRNLLMWSHYSEGHKGVVIGFDVSRLNLGVLIEPVTYVKQRIEITPPWRLVDRNLMRAMITSKSDMWAYEREHRAMLNLKQLTERPLGNGRIGHFVEIPPTSIVEVIFGFRSTTVKRMHDAFRKYGIRPALKHAKPHPTDFGLLLEDEDG